MYVIPTVLTIPSPAPLTRTVFNPDNDLWYSFITLPPFYWWGEWGSGRLGNLPKAHTVVSGREGFEPRTVMMESLFCQPFSSTTSASFFITHLSHCLLGFECLCMWFLFLNFILIRNLYTQMEFEFGISCSLVYPLVGVITECNLPPSLSPPARERHPSVNCVLNICLQGQLCVFSHMCRIWREHIDYQMVLDWLPHFQRRELVGPWV